MTPMPPQTTVEEAQEAVRSQERVHPCGARTKGPLAAAPPGVASLDLSGLRGVTEYEPGECTFTAWSGTPVADVEALLGEHGHYLPFDPPFPRAGATLGGTVAAGLSGPGRYRYGGVRDFLLGARFIDGEGTLVRSGGRVVKNAAGFYVHNLLVGSRGEYGAIVELTFKVFPRPEARITLRSVRRHLADALDTLARLRRSAFDIEALDLDAPATLYVRIAGLQEALAARGDAIARAIGGTVDILERQDDARWWEEARECRWLPEGWSVVRVPLTRRHIEPLDAELAARDALRRYSVGGQVAWIGWRGSLDALHGLLLAADLSGVVVRGPGTRPALGRVSGEPFAARARRALDPLGKFRVGSD